MTLHFATREFDVTDGKAVLSSGEVRYTFTVFPGRPALNWENASEGFSPAERPQIDIRSVEIRMHQSHPWRTVDGFAFDMLSADVPDSWFFEQIEADA